MAFPLFSYFIALPALLVNVAIFSILVDINTQMCYNSFINYPRRY